MVAISMQQLANDVAALRGRYNRSLVNMTVTNSFTPPDLSVWNHSGITMASGKNIVGADGSTWSSTGILMASGAYVTNDSWHALSYATNWINFGGGNVTGQYRLVSWGNCVQIVGVIENNTGGSSSGPIATLPAGYRPTHRMRSAVYSSAVANNWLDLNTSGTLTLVTAITTATVIEVNSIFALDP
jgi:hypothetical protein